MSYRKREIAHWNQGKGCKGTRKAKESNYVRTEIQVQLVEQNDDFHYRHKSKRKPNMLARLQHRVEWYEQVLSRHKDRSDSWSNYLRSGLKDAKKKLAQLQEKE